MDATELNPTEILALAGLALHLASADGELTQEEAVELRHLGEEIGGTDTFSAAITTAEARFDTAQAALDYAAGVTREDARQLIHTVLSDLAHSDDLHPREQDMLARLRLMWGIRSR